MKLSRQQEEGEKLGRSIRIFHVDGRTEFDERIGTRSQLDLLAVLGVKFLGEIFQVGKGILSWK